MDLLSAAIVKLERLNDSPPPGFTENNIAAFGFAFATAAGVLGAQSGRSDFLEKSVTAYQTVLKLRPREAARLAWASIQNNLGNALSRLGEREEGMARLEVAVSAYGAALTVYTRDDRPLDWAMTQNNLGNTLLELGNREPGTARLEAAASAYRAALEHDSN